MITKLGCLNRIIIKKFTKIRSNRFWYLLQCNICKKSFELQGFKFNEGKGKFCSKKCYGVAKVTREGPRRILRYQQCKICGKNMLNKLYCSQKCLAVAYQNEGNPCWRGGISRLPYHHSFREKLKEEIRLRDNYTCQKCFQPNLSSFDAHVHHVDGDKMNCDPKNLVIICRWCHGSMSGKGSYSIL